MTSNILKFEPPKKRKVKNTDVIKAMSKAFGSNPNFLDRKEPMAFTLGGIFVSVDFKAEKDLLIKESIEGDSRLKLS
jgi:hypothetical protein